MSENFPSSAQAQVIAINNIGDTGGFYIDTDRQLKSLTEGGNRFLMDSQPLFKEDQTEQNLVIVLSA